MSGRQYQDVARDLRALIRADQVQPGTRLMPERALSQRLGVPRSLVREALILLEIEEIVEVRKGSGVFLRRDARLDGSAGRDDIGPFELLQARQLVESSTAAFAARMVTKGDILRMRETLDRERVDLEKRVPDYSSDRRFHGLIAEATQNSVMVDVVDGLWQKREQSPMWQKLHARIFETDYRREWLDDHGAILAALQARDPDRAKAAMWHHLHKVRETLMILSDIEDPNFDGYLFEAAADVG